MAKQTISEEMLDAIWRNLESENPRIPLALIANYWCHPSDYQWVSKIDDVSWEVNATFLMIVLASLGEL